eukprot:g10255.t1
MRTTSLLAVVAFVLSVARVGWSAEQREAFVSHPPTRPLPAASSRPLNKGPVFFVDVRRGDDRNDGSRAKPWKSLTHGAKQLKPGHTLCLRGGTYYEHPTVNVQGTEERPIVIRAYPGELVVIDGGLREFFESPQTSWTPFPGGASHEFRSTKTYPDLASRDGGTNVLGLFGDSMVPLHGYRHFTDLRSPNEYFSKLKESKTEAGNGIYCGPGLFYNVKSGHIHVRLAHTHQKALGNDNYRGITDPRKIPLVVAGLNAGPALTIDGARYLKIQDLVVRGARTATVSVSNSINIEFDGVTAYGGSTAFGVRDTAGLRLLHCACRGIAAPWTYRGSLKYRAIEARIFSASGWSPTSRENRDFELAYSEFTDCVDGVFIGNVHKVRFHHNLVDNISDDGMFLTATTDYDGTTPGGDVHIYQNRFGRCLTTFAFGVGHGRQKMTPRGRQTGAGVYIYRNVFDFRRAVMYQQPKENEAKITTFGRIAGDHGGPLWEPMTIYHNTILQVQSPFRAYYLAGLGGHLAGGSKRRLFNNIVAHTDSRPGYLLPKVVLPDSVQAVSKSKTGKPVDPLARLLDDDLKSKAGKDKRPKKDSATIARLKKQLAKKSAPKLVLPVDLQADGNLHWNYGQPVTEAELFSRFRNSPEFVRSKKLYKPGWIAHDIVADPRFVLMKADWRADVDLRLQRNSPARNAGVRIPADWPDPFRNADRGRPDVGAIPAEGKPWRVGIHGRWSVFGGRSEHSSTVAAAAVAVKNAEFLIPRDKLPQPTSRAMKPVAVVEGYPAFDAPLIRFALQKQGIPFENIERKWLKTEDYNRPTLELSKRIDAACDQFESELKAGKQPSIERYLEGWQEPDRTTLRLELLAVEKELGANPAERSAATDVLSTSQSQTLNDTAKNLKAGLKTDHDLKQLGRFEILSVLGSGGFGTVYRARDTRLNREIALKVPHASTLRTQENVTRFRREAESVAAIKHENLCMIYDADEIDGTHFIAMELVAGEPLSEITKKRGPWPQREAAELIATLAAAADVAHQHGVIHRDLKPANVLISDKAGKPVITDFGLVRRDSPDEDELTVQGEIVGTPAYMSPEQAAGEIDVIGPTTDVYSLGTMLYELLSGKRPYQGSVEKVIHDVRSAPLQPPSQHQEDIDPQLEAICLKAMSRDIADRYQTMAELANALGQWLQAEADGTTKTQPVSLATAPARQPRFPHRWVWPAVTGVLLIVAVLASMLWPGKQKQTNAKPAAAPAKVVNWNKPVYDFIERVFPSGIKGGGGRMLYTEITLALDLQQERAWALSAKASRDGNAYLFGVQNNKFKHRKATPEEVDRMKLHDSSFLRIGPVQSPRERPCKNVPVRLGSPRLRIEKENGRYYLRGTVQCEAKDAPAMEDLKLIVSAPSLGRSPAYRVEYFQKLGTTGIPTQVKVDISLTKQTQVLMDPRDVHLRLQAFLLEPQPSIYAVSGILPCRIACDRHRYLAEWVIRLGGWVSVTPSPNKARRSVDQLPAEDFQILTAGFENNRKIGNDHLRAFSEMPTLKSLFLSGTSIEDVALERLSRTNPTLTWIDLSDTKVTDAGIRNLQQIPSLNRIALNETAVTDVGLKHLAALPGLHSIDVARTSVTDIGLAYLKDRRQFRRLNLIGTNVSNAGIKSLTKMKGLEALFLGSCRIDDKGLLQIENLTALEMLNLDNTGVSDAGLKSLQGMSRLASLSIKFNEVTDAGLQHLVKLPRLTELMLEDTDVADAGLTTLAKMPQLETLDLMDTRITDDGLKALQELKRFKYLNLNGNDLSNEGLNALRRMERLEFLALNHTRVTDDGLDRLWDLKKLKIVGLRGTAVTPKGVSSLKRHLPNCAIDHLHDRQFLRESRAADWAIRTRGIIKISHAGETKTVRQIDNLPAKDFQVLRIDLSDLKRVDDHDLQRLKGLAGLKGLLLSSTGVTDAGLDLISTLATLEELNLAHTAVSDKALEPLKRLTKLKTLNVGGTKLTDAGFAALRKALPGCAIER